MSILHEEALEGPERAAIDRFRELCTEQLSVRLSVHGPTSRSDRGGILVRVAADHQTAANGPDPRGERIRAAQGYRLRVLPQRVEVLGRSPAGLFYGLQTLGQILLCCGRRWPGLEIDDTPDFAARGFSYDVSRGKVPTLETLKHLVDRLAAVKANHLQLYVEHTFAFRFNPNIGRDCSPLTADEIQELDAYCALHRMELVPSLASCGHMGFILSLPEYRHLAEVEGTKSWPELGWMERMRGLTLDVRNPQTWELLESMYDEFLPLFSSRLANVCCDETYDLGRGKNRQRAEEVGSGELYVEHLAFLERLCRKHGKRLMFWGDIIKKYPALLSRIPKDAIVLNWGYAADADYDSTAMFCDAGLTTFVCPGTSAWNRILNDINAADLNIRRYAAAGKKYGAAGLLNTDWGDEGHVNLLSGSWHPIVLGAAMAWNVAAPPPGVFDRVFSRLVLGDDSTAVVEMLRRVVAVSNMPRSWPAFCTPLIDTVPEGVLNEERLAQWHSLSLEAAAMLSRHPRIKDSAALDLRELALSCRLNALVAERFGISRQLAVSKGVPDRPLAQRLRRFADACEQIVAPYEAAWLARNKPSCLHEVTAVFRRLAGEARSCAGTGAQV